MKESLVTIHEERCHGCGYCVEFCPRGCLEIAKGTIGPLGYAMAAFTKPEQCNSCGFCARMCPHWAIEVSLPIEEAGKEKAVEKVAAPPRLALSPPLANCPGCQHPTVGRIIAEVLDELGLDGKFIALDGINCSTSTTVGMDFSQVVGINDDPIALAIATKREHPEKIVFAVQNTAKFDSIGFDSFLAGPASGEKVTIINCNDTAYRQPLGWHILPVMKSLIAAGGVQEEMTMLSPLPFAEVLANLKEVAYSARGALTSPDDYERTKSYIRSAIEAQRDGAGFSYVEVLCGAFCFPYGETPTDCLKWIKEEMVKELPIGEFKNIKK
jgi:2-oxoglutarate ferredoxin oxidoreductase subunit beta